MTLQCSLQLALYLAKRRAHMPTEQAAAEAGILLGEARLHDQAEAQGEYAHIDTTEMPPPDFKQSAEPAAGTATLRESVNEGRDEARLSPAKDGPGSPHTQEDTMGRTRRKAADEVVEIKKPDFALAKRIYFNDIKPSRTKQAEHGQELSQAFTELKNTANVDPQMARLAFRLAETEESKRDHQLRCLNGLLKSLNIYAPHDLVDEAEGRAQSDNVIPIGETSRPSLATIPADDNDLAGDQEADTEEAGAFTEAAE
jgi:hypothetical protein